jgi:hypothetical protein
MLDKFVGNNGTIEKPSMTTSPAMHCSLSSPPCDEVGIKRVKFARKGSAKSNSVERKTSQSTEP